MKIGIVCDDWKIEIFRKHLKGYKFTEIPGDGPLSGCIVIQIESDTAEEIESIARKANKEAARKKRWLIRTG